MTNPRTLHSLRAFLTVFCVSLLLGGCANVDVDMTTQPQVYTDNLVQRNPVQIYVQPDRPPETSPRTLFMPFRVTQKMEDATTIGRNISYYIWQNWLQTQALSVCEFAMTDVAYRPDHAMAMARAKGADMVIGGYITHIVDGGTTGDSSLSVSIEAYDVHSGNLIWSMAQGGYMQQAKVKDFIMFAVNTRMPMSPIGAIASALAQDMSLKVKHWITPPPPESKRFTPEPPAF